MANYWLSLNGNALPLSRLLQWRSSPDARPPTLVAGVSQSVYGLGEKIFTETAPLQPSDPYGLSKAIGEWAVSAVSGNAGDIIIRFPSLYGPDDPLPHVTRLMLERSLAGQSSQLTSLAWGQVRKQLMFVEDAAVVLVKLALSPVQVMPMPGTENMRSAPLLLNTASLELLSIREIADRITEAIRSSGISVEVETLEE
jgi:nucleoside-diphosphate-sugar epimerase